MSAFISHAYADRIHLLTDGAFFKPDGTIVRISKKVEILPNHKIAITGRGSEVETVVDVISKFILLSANEASKFSTDDMLDVIRAGFVALSDKGKIDAEFLIAAWSETEGPLHFLVMCHGRAADIEAFEMHNPGPGTQLQAGPRITYADVGASLEDVYSPDYPEKFGAKMIGAMRAVPCATSTRPDALLGVVGGRADLTTITADGITQRLLATWEETIGARIDPSVEARIEPAD